MTLHFWINFDSSGMSFELTFDHVDLCNIPIEFLLVTFSKHLFQSSKVQFWTSSNSLSNSFINSSRGIAPSRSLLTLGTWRRNRIIFVEIGKHDANTVHIRNAFPFSFINKNVCGILLQSDRGRHVRRSGSFLVNWCTRSPCAECVCVKVYRIYTAKRKFCNVYFGASAEKFQ